MLRQQLYQDQITALKSGDKVKLDTLRYILSQVKYKEVEKKIELDDEETITILKKFEKELKESAEAFEKGNRNDLLDGVTAQLDIIKKYMPSELSDEELHKEVEKLKQDNLTLYEKNAKVLIGICMKALKNKADPARIMATIQKSG
ncbi:MAG: GatB/YqeY domain-containing protein [Candidatus Roizmanbacteria bacterium]